MLDLALLKGASSRISHRGPDASRTVSGSTDYCHYYATFHRLRVNGQSDSEMQPFAFGKDNFMMCNGEIWDAPKDANHVPGQSDCRGILRRLEEGSTMFDVSTWLDDTAAVYALVVLQNNNIWLARDRFGVRELYFAHLEGGGVAVASEAKALQGLPVCTTIRQVPSGLHLVQNQSLGVARATRRLVDCAGLPPLHMSFATAKARVRAAFMAAVQRRLMTDRPVAVFLSGGFDSSAVTGALRELLGAGKPIHTFSISLPGSTDEPYVHEVAAHNATIHTQFYLEMEDVLPFLAKAIFQLETWDPTTVRAGGMMLLLAHFTKYHFEGLGLASHEKPAVIFTGEGADEVGASYLYFHDAPSPEAFDAERRRLLDEIHFFDGLRVSKATAARGFEARLPFLDSHFVDTALSVPLHLMQPSGDPGLADLNPYAAMEKPLFRAALGDLMPASVAGRTKEALSDGVSAHQDDGEALHLACQAYAGKRILTEDDPGILADIETPTPAQVEAAYYRLLYDRFFPGQAAAIPHAWLPKWNEAAAAAGESSARALAAHRARTRAEA